MGANKNTQKAMIKQGKRMKELRGPIEELKKFQPLGKKRLPTTKKYGALVRKYRIETGYSIQMLADKIGITRQSMCDIEKGKRAKINKDLMYAIAVVLDCSIDNLLGRTKKKGKISKSGKQYSPGVVFAPPEEKDIALALLNIHRRHPELEQRIIWLAKHGTDVDFQKVNSLLAAGLQELFTDSSFSIN